MIARSCASRADVPVISISSVGFGKPTALVTCCMVEDILYINRVESLYNSSLYLVLRGAARLVASTCLFSHINPSLAAILPARFL